MLPYTPLHHLLLHDSGGALVMTSGNLSDEPIAFDDDEARARLGEVADAFLAHDRPIHRRCEDSVVRAGFPVRRSRGFTPEALPLPVSSPRPLVAVGRELKATFCVATADGAFLSPHLGDLDSEDAYRAFRTDLDLYLAMLGVEPAAVACDLHPEYLSTKWAHEQGAAARRGAAPPRPRRRLPRRARRGRAGARARLRRHRLRHRRDALGRRAPALRPGAVRAPRLARPGAAAGRRGGDPRALAARLRPPRARRAGRSRGSGGSSCARA